MATFTDIFGTSVSDAPVPTNGNGAVGTATPSATPSSRLGQNEPVGGAVRNGVYYYIFLAVLVVLAVIAAALTYRSYRLRRRYRTATQLAIARGDPIPQSWFDDDMWGVGIWRHAPGRNWAAVGTGHGRRERKWVRIPKLFDAVVADDKAPLEENEKGKAVADYDDEWDGISPVMLQSMLPDETEAAPEAPPPPPPPPPHSGAQSTTAGDRLRSAGQGLRRAVGFDNPPPIPAPDPDAPMKQKEADRIPDPAEPVRIAVMIQMPGFPGPAPVEDGEEQPGWRPGMELGVWEGVVEGDGHAQHTTYPPPSHPPPGVGSYAPQQSGMYPPPPGPPPSSAAHAHVPAASLSPSHHGGDVGYGDPGHAAHRMPPPDTNPYAQRPDAS